jgi:hypothetical protein
MQVHIAPRMPNVKGWNRWHINPSKVQQISHFKIIYWQPYMSPESPADTTHCTTAVISVFYWPLLLHQAGHHNSLPHSCHLCPQHTYHIVSWIPQVFFPSQLTPKSKNRLEKPILLKQQEINCILLNSKVHHSVNNSLPLISISFIQYSALWRVQSLLQNDSSTQCDLELPPSNESILFCP